VQAADIGGRLPRARGILSACRSLERMLRRKALHLAAPDQAKGVRSGADTGPVRSSTTRPEDCSTRCSVVAGTRWIRWQDGPRLVGQPPDRLCRTGRPPLTRLFGSPSREEGGAHPDISASFDALMGPLDYGTPDSERRTAGGWEGKYGRTVGRWRRRHGACRGHLASRPAIQGILVDRRARWYGALRREQLQAGGHKTPTGSQQSDSASSSRGRAGQPLLPMKSDPERRDRPRGAGAILGRVRKAAHPTQPHASSSGGFRGGPRPPPI